MSDMKISIGLRGKSGAYLCVDTLPQIFIYLLLNKIFRNYCLFSHFFPP